MSISPKNKRTKSSNGYPIELVKSVARESQLSPPPRSSPNGPDRRGRPSARLIHVLLADRCDDKWQCFPSNRTLCRQSGMAPSSVRAAIDVLVKEGYVERVGTHKSGTTVYQLHFPPKVSDGDAPPDSRRWTAVAPTSDSRRGSQRAAGERATDSQRGAAGQPAAKNRRKLRKKKPNEVVSKEEKKRTSAFRAARRSERATRSSTSHTTARGTEDTTSSTARKGGGRDGRASSRRQRSQRNEAANHPRRLAGAQRLPGALRAPGGGMSAREWHEHCSNFALALEFNKGDFDAAQRQMATDYDDEPLARKVRARYEREVSAGDNRGVK